MKIRALLVLSALILIPNRFFPAQSGSALIASPDGRIQMTIATVVKDTPSDSAGQLAFRIAFQGKPIFAWSQLAMELEGQPVLGNKVKLVSGKASSVDETYKMAVGKSNTARNHYNSILVEVEETEAPGRKFQLEARVFDDGAAFRYLIPRQPGLQEIRIANELTRFNFSKDATTYPLIHAGFRTSHENNYVKLPLSALKADSLLGVPFLTELPGTAWVALTEAHLENYAGLYLTHSTKNDRELESRLAPSVDNPKISVMGRAPLESPWRAMMISDQPGDLIESNIVVNLNPPCAIEDTSWIRAGKSAWDWWSGSAAENLTVKPGMNTETMKYYIDFASNAGFEYMLIDAGWSGRDILSSSPAIDMPELLRYARSKNVKLWLWTHWTAIEKQMNDAFPLYEKWGIVGVKIDFMDRDDQWMVDFYHRVVKKAAQHHLMIDFHGAYKPDGMRRTYPNLMTREGVLGLEYNKWSARDTPEHDVMLAFTRMLAGPMDFTPGGFNNASAEDFEPRNLKPMVMGTRAHQTALFVVFESPFMVAADWPGAYAGQKELDFLKAVPSTWDETRVLEGKVGSHVVVARRRGDEWYIGAITGWNAVDLQLPLGFLGKGDYLAEVYSDALDSAQNPQNSIKGEQKLTSAATLKLKLVSGGGAAVRIRPVE